MKFPRVAFVPLVLFVVLMTSASRCDPTTVEDVAGALAKDTKYSEPNLADALKAANNGKTLSDDTAKGFDSSEAIATVIDSTNEVADAACHAFDFGGEILEEQINDLLQRGQANDLLSRMRGDVSAGKATKDSVDLACKTKDALSSF